MSPNPNSLLALPNLLSLSRVPLGVVLFVLISYQQWWPAIGVFSAAAVTDWLDGWLARRWRMVSLVGRSLDPLTDKLLVCGAFVYLLPVGPDAPATGVQQWMVTVIVGREVLITGLRGIIEASGVRFSADWFGKLKMVMQCGVIVGLLVGQAIGPSALDVGVSVLLYLTLAATVGSGVQYLVKAGRILDRVAAERAG